METNGGMGNKWRFRGTAASSGGSPAAAITVREVRIKLMENIDPNDDRHMLPLGHGDPSAFPSFRTCRAAEDAVVDTIRSGQSNCYASSGLGVLPARRAVAEYLSRDLPYKLSSDDVLITVGCSQAIDVIFSALARPGANILLPRPGYPYYQAYSTYIGFETRYFDLIPERGWEVDLDSVEALADSNTVAMIIINPGNPCGNVYTHNHLHKVAETARKIGILVIADEVYNHLTLGRKPFVPMGVFGDIVPVITLGSLSKRWIVPGWRLGWLVINDTHGILSKYGVVESIKSILNMSSDPATFIQMALPQILGKTKEDFFSKIIDMLRHDVDICYERLNEIPCMECPYKPEGSMYLMAKINVALLDDIDDDIDFCLKLAKEEKMIVLPGATVGIKNWVRITYAIEPETLEEGLERMKAFCQRHAKIP